MNTKATTMTHKKKKIDDGKYEYRGFVIWKHPYAGCWRIFAGTPIQWVSEALRLDAAVALIDAWYHADDIHATIHSRFANAVDLAKRTLCEAGEPVACPDAHLCRHGIDN
jgi:hypothetical protein